MEKRLRCLSFTDRFGDVNGRKVYLSSGAYVGTVYGETGTHWILTDGDGPRTSTGGPMISRSAGSFFYIEEEAKEDE